MFTCVFRVEGCLVVRDGYVGVNHDGVVEGFDGSDVLFKEEVFFGSSYLPSFLFLIFFLYF